MTPHGLRAYREQRGNTPAARARNNLPSCLRRSSFGCHCYLHNNDVNAVDVPYALLPLLRYAAPGGYLEPAADNRYLAIPRPRRLCERVALDARTRMYLRQQCVADLARQRSGRQHRSIFAPYREHHLYTGARTYRGITGCSTIAARYADIAPVVYRLNMTLMPTADSAAVTIISSSMVG